MNKSQKKEWNNYVLKMFPSKQLKEKTRQNNRDIDRIMPVESKNNDWRVDMLRFE